MRIIPFIFFLFTSVLLCQIQIDKSLYDVEKEVERLGQSFHDMSNVLDSDTYEYRESRILVELSYGSSYLIDNAIDLIKLSKMVKTYKNPERANEYLTFKLGYITNKLELQADYIQNRFIDSMNNLGGTKLLALERIASRLKTQIVKANSILVDYIHSEKNNTSK